MNDLVVTTNDTYLDPYFFVSMIDQGPNVQNFKIVQRSDRSLEVLIIPENDEETAAIREHVSAELSAVDPQLSVEISMVQEVPEMEGWKRRYVMSELSDELEVSP